MGLGGVLVAALERWLRRNDQLSERRYRQLRKAYSGLLKDIDNRAGLEVMDLIQIEGDVRYWVSRVLLVFPKYSMEYWSGAAERNVLHFRTHRDAIILNMRNDLDSKK